jgi:cytochrome c-type biogenesis protein CcmF
MGTPVDTPSVRAGFTEDLFLVLDQAPVDDPSGPIRLRVIVRPMISWLWAGGALMGFGTLLAIFPGSRRRGTEAVSARLGERLVPAPVPTADPDAETVPV